MAAQALVENLSKINTTNKSLADDAQLKRRPAPLSRVLSILKKHRKKTSLYFLLKWVIIKRPKPNLNKLSIAAFLHIIGHWSKDSQDLYYIHVGIKSELGSLIAMAATLEIYKASEETTQLYYEKQIARNNKKTEKAIVKKLRKRYGKNIPSRFLMTKEERKRKLKELKKYRRQLIIYKDQQRDKSVEPKRLTLLNHS